MAHLPPRLLPWLSLEGKPCWLSTDDPDSRMSRLADDMEDEQMECGEQVCAGSRAVLADRAAGERAVRFALSRATESLADCASRTAGGFGRSGNPRRMPRKTEPNRHFVHTVPPP
ncbi:hypothetical protein ACIQUY_14420 [Streptomyces sp. NPDC090231]|uniref:hypothetical protein n=1 Tax=unclassified Streptomyces TaxID=2593676 RepID=UPI0038063C60